MTNCFDKVRLQQLIADTTHVETLCANIFHNFFQKLKGLDQEMRTAALLPIEDAKEAVQDLIYEFRIQDPATVVALGELFDQHCLDPNGFSYHAFISLVLIMIKRVVLIRDGVASVEMPQHVAHLYQNKLNSNRVSPRGGVPPAHMASPRMASGMQQTQSPRIQPPIMQANAPSVGQRVVSYGSGNGAHSVPQSMGNSAASTPKPRNNRFAHINLLPVSLTPRQTGRPTTSKVVVPPLAKGNIVPKEERTYYYRCGLPADQEWMPNISPTPSQHRGEEIQSDHLVALSKNCGPTHSDVQSFRSSLRDYTLRHEVQEAGNFRQGIQEIISNASNIKGGR